MLAQLHRPVRAADHGPDRRRRALERRARLAGTDQAVRRTRGRRVSSSRSLPPLTRPSARAPRAGCASSATAPSTRSATRRAAGGRRAGRWHALRPAMVAPRRREPDQPRRGGGRGARRHRHAGVRTGARRRSGRTRGSRGAMPRGRSARSTTIARSRRSAKRCAIARRPSASRRRGRSAPSTTMPPFLRSLPALDDQDPRVRRQAAWALGALDDSRAVAGLSKALNDADEKTQEPGGLGARRH